MSAWLSSRLLGSPASTVANEIRLRKRGRSLTDCYTLVEDTVCGQVPTQPCAECEKGQHGR
jgi:hypothetical protein